VRRLPARTAVPRRRGAAQTVRRSVVGRWANRYGSAMPSQAVIVRRARTPDVPAVKSIVDIYAGSGRRLLAKDLGTLYEDVQDFQVAELDGAVVGCGALHVLWADLGEIRTLAVHPEHRHAGVGAAVLDALIDTARGLGLGRLFALSFHTRFFGRHGFVEIDGTPVDPDTYDALRRSYDPGVAEFLGLEYVKPNTLGNTRMLLKL
jgi:amino-acid N-acetyltransferase